MHVEIVTTVEAFASLRDEWRELLTRAPRATVFQRPEWLLPWADLFLEGDLRAIVVRDGDRLIALAPLYVWRAPDGARELRFLGSGNTDYLDAIIDTTARDEVLPAIAEAIATLREWDIARFEQMRDGAEFLRLPVPAGADGGQIVSQDPCPKIDLPSDPAALYGHLAQGFVRRVRQAERRAARAGMRMITVTKNDVERYVRWLIELHERRWNERQQAGVLATPRARAFLERVAIGLAKSGMLVLRALENQDRVVAAMCGFRDNATVRYYLGGFDPAFKQVSPGVVLIAYCIEQAIANGVKQFDFLRGGERYKYEWGGVDRYNHARVIARRSLHGNV